MANGQTSAEMVAVGQLLYNHALQTDDFDQAMRRQAQYKTEEGRAILRETEGDTHKNGGCGCGGN